MDLRRIRCQLWPPIERDPKFRQYLLRLSRPAIQVIAVIEIAAALLLQVGRMAAGETGSARLWEAGAVIIAGALTLLADRLEWSGRHPRLLGALSAWIACSFLFAVTLWKAAPSFGSDDYVLAAVTLIVVGAVAIVPFLPWQAFILGVAIQGMYVFSYWQARIGGGGANIWHTWEHEIFLLLLTMLGAGIAAANHQHRVSEFEAAQQAVRSAEALTGAQLRAQLAENAISIGKLAAALSHEINSPLGVLRSSIDTLVAMSEAPPELAATRDALRGAIAASAARIDEVSRRLRRFVSLEDAELKSADINELLTDVTLLHQDEIAKGQIRIEFDLQESIPPLTCRPQLLTAVFSTLLSNAIHAVNGDGVISIESRGRDKTVEITVRDNGRGMSQEEAETIFEPSFKVDGSRVSAGNWSLFNSRQIVYEHGGEISIETTEGKGSAFRVLLPLVSAS